MQWLSPAFPIGAYASSQRLEAAIASGDVGDAVDLHGWIATVLTHGSGHLDAVFLALARREGDVMALADLARAMAASPERLTEMTEQGRAFGLAIAAITALPQPALPYALAVGHATRALRVATSDVVMLWLHGLAENYATPGLDDLSSTTPGADLAAMRHETMNVRIYRT